MSLSTKIAAALDENTKVHVLPCQVTVEEGPHKLTLHLTSLDTVGLAFDALEFVTTARSDWSSAALKDWGQRLASRLTYLLEPLQVLEVDPQGGEVQIRSERPTTRNDQRGYYEVRLFQNGTLSLQRLVFDETSRQRLASVCQLTREVLDRLADDIAASVP
jgi:hypothetical protein